MKNKDDIKIDERERRLFSDLRVEYNRSKKDVWADMQTMLEDEPGTAPGDAGLFTLTWRRMSLAASVLLLIGAALFARFYTVSYEVGAGAKASMELPDGSMVHLNAVSSATYAPYAWRFRRSVALEGEAFFEVEKGRRFVVVSDNGTTEVLGTSFNIYARGSSYEVFCATGKVKVRHGDREVILSPGDFAELDQGEGLNTSTLETDDAVLAWRGNRFVYNTTPLTKVLQDMERQYAVAIELNVEHPETLHYTGLFERSVSAKDALQIICYSFDLQVTEAAPDAYRITNR